MTHKIKQMEHLHPTHLPLYHKCFLMEENRNQLLKASDSQAVYSRKLKCYILDKTKSVVFPFNHCTLTMQLFHKTISLPSPVCTTEAQTVQAILACESKPLENSIQIVSKHFLIQKFCYSL